VRRAVDIVDLAQGGEGVGRLDERAVFVPYAAPGDRVTAEVPEGVGPAHARLVEVLQPGAARVEAPCRHFGPGAHAGCGGCEWLHVAYAAQLAAKQRFLTETLRRIGGLAPGSYQAPEIVPSPSPLRYRARAKFHVDRASGRLVFFRRRSHEPIGVRECHLLELELDALREVIGPALARTRLAPREVTLEWSRHAGRGSAFLQLPSTGSAARQRAEELLAVLPALQGVVLGAEGSPLERVGDPVLRQARRPDGPFFGGFGAQEPVEGEPELQRSRPDVFQQANRRGNALLVDAALGLLRPEGEDVLELFCGAGNFTGPLAARARSVHAVEAQGPALELARLDLEEWAGAVSSRRSKVRLFAGDALALARAFARETAPARRFGAALLDPPREGCRGVGHALRALEVPRAVYVSCDPATLARDLKACGEAGYRVEVVQAVDMFPQTHHVEGVALLVAG